MQLLNYINKYFDNLSTFQKIEMYLIPIITALLLIYNFPKLQTKVLTNVNDVNQEVYDYEIKKQKLLKKINKMHSVKVVKDIQKYAQDINVKVIQLKVIEKNISLEVQGNLKPILRFINFSESNNDYMKIENLILSQLDDKDEIRAFLDISYSKIIRTQQNYDMTNEIDDVSNPFGLKVAKPLPRLFAIVNDHVLINNKWLKQNDIFDGYKVIKIHLDYVELKSDSKVFKLELFSE